MVQQLLVYTKAIPKGRPRIGRYGAYTPSRTVEFERLIRAEAVRAGIKPIIGAATILINIYVKSPKKSAHEHPSSYDVDNAGKAILDALNGILYEDDRHITKLTIEKEYSYNDAIQVTGYPSKTTAGA